MKVGVDTNILVYAQGVDGLERRRLARAALECVAAERLVIPVQVLGELFSVLVRKARRDGESARRDVLEWQEVAQCVPTTGEVLLRAVDLAARHRLAIWDAVIFAAAAVAGCEALLSEDMQDGFTWGGVTVIDPFAAGGMERLRRLVGG